jgi:hypothetical protein
MEKRQKAEVLRTKKKYEDKKRALIPIIPYSQHVSIAFCRILLRLFYFGIPIYNREKKGKKQGIRKENHGAFLYRDPDYRNSADTDRPGGK